MMTRRELRNFVEESNLIEGILGVRTEEVEAHRDFLHQNRVTIASLCVLVDICAPGHAIRSMVGDDVVVGNHVPPPGGHRMVWELESILSDAAEHRVSPHWTHCRYESLHPFTDGNGRSGKALWLWCMIHGGAPVSLLRRGFLTNFYYQTLEAHDRRMRE